ncbi:MAG TPA: hypothetical protein VGQ59_21805 [Cyclobacteriaceae bacterium]|jgi:hypothetical protein|nr:hypothetical protein [Cyclobacteriaceae bacterium]
MKIRNSFLLLCSIVLSIGSANAQGMLNKLKSKANQEVNKLEKEATSSATQTPNKNKLSANVTRSSVVKLGADEIFDYSENCIDLGTSLDQISFIISKQSGSSNQCYTYKNGTRTPVACPNGSSSGCQTVLQCSYSALRELDMNGDEFKKYVSNETESHSIQQPTVTDEQMKAMAAYMTPEQLAEVKKSLAEAQKQTAGKSFSTIKSSSVSFNGKKYGPYKLVQKLYLTNDGKNFFAIVMEDKAGNSQGQNKMITSVSTKVLILGDMDSPVSCFASPDNSDFGYVAMSLTGQKYVIVTSSGKTYERPLSTGFSGVWFSAIGNHVIFLSQNQLAMDGQVIKTFGNEGTPNPCDLFVSADGKGVTIIKDNKVSFADGDYFEYPMKIAIVYVGGKPYYKWMALENKEVVVYQKPY